MKNYTTQKATLAALALLFTGLVYDMYKSERPTPVGRSTFTPEMTYNPINLFKKK